MRFKKIIVLIILFGAIPLVKAQTNSSSLFLLDEISEIEKRQNSTLHFTESQITNNYDVHYYRLNLTVNPSIQFISGSVTSYFTPSTNLNKIYFELNSLLNVDSITYRNIKTTFDHQKNQILINQSFSAHKLDSITIFYSGTPPEGASFKTELHQNTPILWTLSEPYGAIDWWPCKQSLTDKADSIDLYITAPKEHKVAGNGTLQSIIKSKNDLITHWKSKYPIAPYLVAIAVTPYAEISFTSQLSKGPLFVQNYVYKEDSANVINQLFVTDTLLRYYDSLIGEYPFMNEKYGHAQFGWGGGMEHQTMSFMSHFGFNLTAHELAHQWFGNKITCGSWSDIWLNEGFATYFAALPLETMYKGLYWNSWKTNYLTRATSNNEKSIYVLDTSNFARIFDSSLSYAKGAYVLHMLRHQIGDSTFFRGIKSYISDPNLTYKTALTTDFFHHIEIVADTNLSLFMNQWIYGIGYPSFNLEWNQYNNLLSINLQETTSSSTTPFFNIKVPVLLLGEKDSLWLFINQNTNQVQFQKKVPFKITHVLIDPEMNIISKGNFVMKKETKKTLTLYPNPSNNTMHIIPDQDSNPINAYYIYNATGKLIESKTSLRLTEMFDIDVTTLPQGNYQIHFTSGNNKITKGFIIAK